MPTKRTAKLVSFGDGGDVVYYGAGCTSSGYGSPERPHAAEVGDGKEFPDGTPALDKRPALATSAGFKFVFQGPMVDVDLAPDTVAPCPDLGGSIVAQAMLQDSGNAYGTYVGLHQVSRIRKERHGPLDYVDTATYIRLWRELGARVGQYKAGKIVWESAT